MFITRIYSVAAYQGRGKKEVDRQASGKKTLTDLRFFFQRKSVGHIHLMTPKRPGRKMNWHERRVWVLVQVN